ncbi:receptor-like protein 11 [Miscanthus floridulus]|uniref:receptor-like protein 11 n=1 Tax=Miscanthus floridulus TaxID=154761 RepID=UPI00345796B0
MVLNLRGNHLSGTWPDEKGESCSLEVIDLHGNQIQGRLPRSLASCKSLRHLDVVMNKFVDVFPSWLGNLPYLWLLILRSNQFYGPLTMPGGNKNHSVANGFFSSLQIVDLARNRFNGALPSEFFNVLKSMIRPQMNPDNIDMGDYSDVADFHLPPAEVQVSTKQLYLTE